MRFFSLFLVLLLFANLSQAQSSWLELPAEEAMNALENEIATRGVSFDFHTVHDAGPESGHDLHGSFTATPGAHIALISNGEVNGLGASPGFTSDGETMIGGRNGAQSQWPDFSNAPQPEGLVQFLAADIIRYDISGILTQLIAGLAPGIGFNEDMEEVSVELVPYAIYDVEWLESETLEEVETRPLSFKLSIIWAEETAVTLWLDAATGTPVRQYRHIESIYGRTIEVETYYSNWSFGDE